LLGYERYYHGRAAGTQVYCLVAMASCALTAVSDSSTNIVGNILTGIGFLGAGIIVKSGTNIRGLTTAASVWSSSAIGILVGLGHYVAAICLTALFIFCTVAIPLLEARFPAKIALAVTLRYREGHSPQEDVVHKFFAEHSLFMASDSLSVNYDGRCYSLQFLVTVGSIARSRSISRISHELPDVPYLEGFSIARTSRA
jgi:putative Mg2+ transporter-C (MgtC) family protein